MAFDHVGDTTKLCRVCMTAKEGHRTDLYDASSFVSGQPSLHGMLKAVCPLVFDRANAECPLGMPTKVCAVCRNATIAAYKLHQMCIETDRRLGELLVVKKELQEALEEDENGEDNEDPLRKEAQQDKHPMEQIEGAHSRETECKKAENSEENVINLIPISQSETMIKVEELDLMDEHEIDDDDSDSFDDQESDAKNNKVKRICKICSEIFYKVSMLRNHMTEKHQLYMCEVCHETFESLSMIVKHKVTQHRKRPSCSNCSEKFENKLDLMYHKKKEQCEKSKKCCNEIFSTRDALTKHRLTHKFKCTICDKVTTSKGALRIHTRRHLGNKQFACDTCPMRFITKAEVDSHSLTHSRTKNAVCDICGSKFTKKTSLKAHVRNVHEGYRPFQCNLCDQKFSLQCLLKRHMYTHTGEKPFKCELCPQAYAQTSDLIKHVARAHGDGNPYRCDRCDESFRMVTDLRQHYRVHMQSGEPVSEQMGEMRFTSSEIFKRAFGKGKPQPEDSGSNQ